MTDKLLIGGINQHQDFHRGHNREAIKEILRMRLKGALEECGSRRFVFAPGCSLPQDVDRFVFTLMKEVVDEMTLC